MNKFSSSFFKFDMTSEQKEYLDIISLGFESQNLFNLPKELRQRILKYEIDDLIFQTAENLFYYVQEEIKKQPKSIKRFLESFVNEYELFMKFFDYVYRFSNLSDFE